MTCRVLLEDIRVQAGDKAILEVDRLELEPGRLHVIIGPNGAGKTTLLRVIAGVARPSNGRVLVCGSSPRSMRGLLSYMPSQLDLMEWARVGDVMEAYRYGAKSWRPRLDLLPEGLGLDRRIGSLSSGERRLVQLAGALSRQPRLLVADEPLSFLDVRNKARVLGIIRDTLDNTTAVVSMHDLEYVSIADTVTLLNNGRIAYSGPPEGLNEDLVSGAYGVSVKWVSIDGRRILVPVF